MINQTYLQNDKIKQDTNLELVYNPRLYFMPPKLQKYDEELAEVNLKYDAIIQELLVKHFVNNEVQRNLKYTKELDDIPSQYNKEYIFPDPKTYYTDPDFLFAIRSQILTDRYPNSDNHVFKGFDIKYMKYTFPDEEYSTFSNSSFHLVIKQVYQNIQK